MSSLHPVIAIACYLVFATSVTFSIGVELLVYTLLLSILYLLMRGDSIATAWRMLKRMRWLFFSILLVYFWFTPGAAVFSLQAEWLPSERGVVEGLLRCLVLILLVLAINLLLSRLNMDDLLEGLLWWLRPLQLFGLSHNRLALRIVLVLQAVTQVQQLYIDKKEEAAGTPMRQASTRLSSLFVTVLEHAEQQPLVEIPVANVSRPPLQQWFWPLLLITILQLTPLMLKELM